MATRIAPAIGRAMIGAVVGYIMTVLFTVIATNHLGLFATEEEVPHPTVKKIIVAGILITAMLAAFFGQVKIRGRAEATIKGMLMGALLLVVAGAFFGKAMFGIIVGLPVGSIVGGIIGYFVCPARKEKSIPEL